MTDERLQVLEPSFDRIESIDEGLARLFPGHGSSSFLRPGFRLREGYGQLRYLPDQVPDQAEEALLADRPIDEYLLPGRELVPATTAVPGDETGEDRD